MGIRIGMCGASGFVVLAAEAFRIRMLALETPILSRRGNEIFLAHAEIVPGTVLGASSLVPRESDNQVRRATVAFYGGNIWVAIHGSNNLLAKLLANHGTQALVQALRRLGYTIELKPDLLAPGRG